MKILNRKSLIFIGIGAVCIILLILTGEGKSNTADEKISYEQQLEEKLTDLISGLTDTDDVKVMVTLECGSEYVYAVDRESSQDHEKTEYYSGSDKEALLIKELNPVVKGVAVVIRGNGKVTKATVTDLVSRVLDLPLRCIFVEIR